MGTWQPNSQEQSDQDEEAAKIDGDADGLAEVPGTGNESTVPSTLIHSSTMAVPRKPAARRQSWFGMCAVEGPYSRQRSIT